MTNLTVFKAADVCEMFRPAIECRVSDETIMHELGHAPADISAVFTLDPSDNGVAVSRYDRDEATDEQWCTLLAGLVIDFTVFDAVELLDGSVEHL